MTAYRFCLALAALSLTAVAAPGQAPPKELLLNVAQGQIPSDTGMDDKTVMEIVASPELGGKALKVPFAAGDSFGIRPGAAKNWKQFVMLRFDAFNPTSAPVNLELTVVHARSTSYQTRAVVPIKLKPGKNEVKLGIDEMANVNGSTPDLANVTKWYILDADGKGPTVLFSDIWLEGGASPATPVAGSASAAALPLIPYRITGKIGGQDVDLLATPQLSGVPAPAAAQATAAQTTAAQSGGAKTGAAPAKPAVGGSDPARVSRIRAAKLPPVDKVIEFQTPEADAICAALEVFPPDNPWNLLVDQWPLHPNSAKIIASIGTDKPLRFNDDMGFIIVPPTQPKLDVKLVAYASESDKGPYPVPANVPIEGWPASFQQRAGGKLTLDDVQRDKLNENSDRHAIVVDPTNRMLYEFYQMKKTDQGWQAACAAIFDLKSNKLRPDGWTSTDAAGLPIFPATVRHDELQRGVVEHALRVTVRNSRRAYVYPATHFASSKTDENMPRMGERIRLRRDFDVSGFSPELKAILTGLKRYGMLVADNGLDWSISVAPDPRIRLSHDEFRKLKGSDFEVVTPPPGYTPPQ